MIKRLAFALSVATLATSSFAQIASDNASNYTTATWINGSNGGTGFQSWTLSSSGAAGFSIGSSTTLNSPGADINTAGSSFLMSSSPGVGSDATRFLVTPLSAGQTFSIDIAVNFRNGNKGIDIRDASNTNIFNLNIGGDNYTVGNATTGNGTLFGGVYSSNTAFHLTLSQIDVNGGTWTITRSGGLTGTASGTYSGDVAGFHMYNFGADDVTGSNLLAFNNLSVTAIPEPSATALVGFSGLILAAVAKRRL